MTSSDSHYRTTYCALGRDPLSREHVKSFRDTVCCRLPGVCLLSSESGARSEWEAKAQEQAGIIQELQQHISHLEHLHEIETTSRKKALAKHKVQKRTAAVFLCAERYLVPYHHEKDTHAYYSSLVPAD